MIYILLFTLILNVQNPYIHRNVFMETRIPENKRYKKINRLFYFHPPRH